MVRFLQWLGSWFRPARGLRDCVEVRKDGEVIRLECRGYLSRRDRKNIKAQWRASPSAFLAAEVGKLSPKITGPPPGRLAKDKGLI